eukprot:758913-Hanusia_phi.AAC.2
MTIRSLITPPEPPNLSATNSSLLHRLRVKAVGSRRASMQGQGKDLSKIRLHLRPCPGWKRKPSPLPAFCSPSARSTSNIVVTCRRKRTGALPSPATCHGRRIRSVAVSSTRMESDKNVYYYSTKKRQLRNTCLRGFTKGRGSKNSRAKPIYPGRTHDMRRASLFKSNN